jgi:hypothetical protein
MTAMKTARHREAWDWPPPRGRRTVAQMRVKLERVEIMVPRRKHMLARFGVILLGALAVTVWIITLLAIQLILIPFLSWRHRKRWGDRAARCDDNLLEPPSPQGSPPGRVSAPWHHRAMSGRQTSLDVPLIPAREEALAHERDDAEEDDNHSDERKVKGEVEIVTEQLAAGPAAGIAVHRLARGLDHMSV